MLGFLLISLIYAGALAKPLDDPIVTLGTGTFTGVNSGSVSKFLGIPFASAPRFDLPQPIAAYVGSQDAKVYGPACPQQALRMPDGLAQNITTLDGISLNGVNAVDQSEDCLTVNVIKPINATSSDKLPVVVWIFGGGFLVGYAEQFDEMGTRVVERSATLQKPVIFVSMNHRVSAYGLIASEEVKRRNVTNIALKDQRVALQWVQNHVAAFGGDPSRVTIWGQSSGAVSASLQMLAYNGRNDNLFHAAFLQSGAPIPVGDISSGQKYYDQLVKDAECPESQNSLDCLRTIPFDRLKIAVDKSPGIFDYQSLVLAWSPRADGDFLSEPPMKQVSNEESRILDIPIVTGNCDDEGTFFSRSTTNVTDEAKFREYIKTIWSPGASDDELAPLWTNYGSNPEEGSPFDTCSSNQLTPQYKRIAAFQGDVVFQMPRRFLLQHLKTKNKVWSYLSKRLKKDSILGSFHGSDLLLAILDDHVINFVNTFDPNTGNGLVWPEYTSESKYMYTFPPEGTVPIITSDIYRDQAMAYLANLALDHPL